jgi:hypothetical protein
MLNSGDVKSQVYHSFVGYLAERDSFEPELCRAPAAGRSSILLFHRAVLLARIKCFAQKHVKVVDGQGEPAEHVGGFFVLEV